jgi:hypothetical protein
MIWTGEGSLPVGQDEEAIGMIPRRDILHLPEIKSDLTAWS